MIRTAALAAFALLTALTAVGCSAGGDDDKGSSQGAIASKGNDEGGKQEAKQDPKESEPACSVGDQRGCLVDGDVAGSQICGPTGWRLCEALPCEPGELAECAAEGGAGMRQCVSNGTWSECGALTECKPGDTKDCAAPAFPPGTLMAPCALQGGEWRYATSACNTPLVLSFDGARVEFTRAQGFFDVVGGGTCEQTDWVSAATPWLALDRDGNGSIDDGGELFGSMTRLPDGQRATNGFEALRPLDSDGDGRITARDEAWGRLRLWRDRDQDRRSSPSELGTLDQEGIVALELGYASGPRCQGGSCEIERASMVFRGASGELRRGEVVDVHLARR